MASLTERKLLEQELSRLLDFVSIEGISDLFSQIILIESSDYLQEYLLALRGSSSSVDDLSVRTFVDNVQKWQRGVTIELETAHIPLSREEVSVEKKYHVEKNEKVVKQQRSTAPTGKRSNRGRGSKQQPKQNTNAIAKATNNAVCNNQNQNQNQNQNSQKKPPAINTPIPNISNIEKPPKATTTAHDFSLKISLLPKGKAETTCGCFGTLHKPFTNCLFCGRIACIKEGYDAAFFCPYCNRSLQGKTLVDKTTQREHNEELEDAIRHKNKLLSFEKDSARRTEVFDDEKDYFSNKTSTWLTQEEKLDSAGREEMRRRDMHDRKKALLSDFIALKKATH